MGNFNCFDFLIYCVYFLWCLCSTFVLWVHNNKVEMMIVINKWLTHGFCHSYSDLQLLKHISLYSCLWQSPFWLLDGSCIFIVITICSRPKGSKFIACPLPSMIDVHWSCSKCLIEFIGSSVMINRYKRWPYHN